MISLKRSFISPDNPLYKPLDREKIIYCLLERYPRLLTENNILQILSYQSIELDYIYRLKDFYAYSHLNNDPDVIDEIIILNEKEEYLQDIDTILRGSEYWMGIDV